MTDIIDLKSRKDFNKLAEETAEYENKIKEGVVSELEKRVGEITSGVKSGNVDSFLIFHLEGGVLSTPPYAYCYSSDNYARLAILLRELSNQFEGSVLDSMLDYGE